MRINKDQAQRGAAHLNVPKPQSLAPGRSRVALVVHIVVLVSHGVIGAFGRVQFTVKYNEASEKATSFVWFGKTPVRDPIRELN